GYLKSNDQQVVVNDNDNITIQSTQPDVVYVPTYDPQTVVTNNYVSYPPPVYSDPYPAYYAPGATFFAGAIVGATFAYAFDWDDDDIDIDCCDSGDINNDINIDRGDVNIGSGNINVDKTKIQERFNGDRTKAGSDGKMKWSSQKARQKSTAARKPAAKPTSANIAKSLGNPKPAAKVQSGKIAQKDAVRGQNSLKATKNPKANINKPAVQKQQKPQFNRQAQQPQNKALQQKQLRQKQGGGGAFGQMAPQRQVKAQSNRGSRSMSSGAQVRPKRR
ncbi:MAG TPA: DUF3300 domain-containing protein, partial [Dongiaceae bacterium]|nr:DUF3300 domain-containing protein [Dongiaceae bacterium]